MHQSVYQLALAQLNAFPADVRLIVIHPNYLPQHTLLTVMFDHACYVRFDGKNLTVDDLHAQLSAAQQIDGTVQPLNAFKTVICDELDRADAAAVDAFLSALLKQFNGRIFVFSRSISPLMAYHSTVRAVTRFLPTMDNLMLWDYAQRNPGGGVLLEVRAFGEGRVQLNGKEITEWDGVLPRALFFFLVDRGMVTRGEIFQTFWSNLSVREATNVFHVTKRKISEVLGMDLTTYEAGFYYISRSIHLSYDVSVFTQLLQDSAVMPLEMALETAQNALLLYRRDFLTSVEMTWSDRRRQDLRQMYTEALVAQARMLEQTGDTAQSLGLMLHASAMVPQREDLVHHIMRLYQNFHRPQEALEAYHRLEQHLRTVLDLAPGAIIRELAAQIEHTLTTGAL